MAFKGFRLSAIPKGMHVRQGEKGLGLRSSSVQFSRSVVFNSMRLHELQHTRAPCPSPIPGVHSDSRPSSPWCHPAISSSVVPFSSWPQSLPASESFPMSQLFVRGGQSTGVSVLASFLPEKSQGWSPSEWTGWISLPSKGLLINFQLTIFKSRLLLPSVPFLAVQLKSLKSNFIISTGRNNETVLMLLSVEHIL